LLEEKPICDGEELVLASAVHRSHNSRDALATSSLGMSTLALAVAGPSGAWRRMTTSPSSSSVTGSSQGSLGLSLSLRYDKPSPLRSPRCGRVLATTFGGDHVDHEVETDAGTLVIRWTLGPAEEP